MPSTRSGRTKTAARRIVPHRAVVLVPVLVGATGRPEHVAEQERNVDAACRIARPDERRVAEMPTRRHPRRIVTETSDPRRTWTRRAAPPTPAAEPGWRYRAPRPTPCCRICVTIGFHGMPTGDERRSLRGSGSDPAAHGGAACAGLERQASECLFAVFERAAELFVAAKPSGLATRPVYCARFRRSPDLGSGLRARSGTAAVRRARR